jgi:hypothetical protein
MESPIRLGSIEIYRRYLRRFRDLVLMFPVDDKPRRRLA